MRAEHPRVLLELSRHILATLDEEAVLSRSLDALRQVIPFTGGLLRVLEDGVFRTAAMSPPAVHELEVRSPADHGLAGSVLSSIEPLYIREVAGEHAEDASVRALSTGVPVKSYLGMALADGDGYLGTLELGSGELNAFSRDQVEAAAQLAPSISIAIRNARIFATHRSAATNTLKEPLDEDFMAVVAHELRTPLAVVLGCAETLAVQAAHLQPAVVEDLSRRTVSAGHRLERLVADLFDMSRIRNGTLRVVPAPTSLRSILSRAAGDAPQSLAIGLELEDDLPLVDVDPNRLVQVLRIILDNAWKHAGEHSEVHVRATRRDGGVTIEIEDDGPGIAPEILDKVFDPFVQAEEPMTRSVGGLGIGLFLARGICELMGARLDARSSEDSGSTFTIELCTQDDLVERVR